MKKIILSLLSFLLVLLPALVFAPNAGAIDVERYVCLGINLGNPEKCDASVNPDEPQNLLEDAAGQVIGILSLVVGIVSVVMIIIGGLRYITSGGDSANVTSAKNTILYAIVGLIIVLISRLIVTFVYSQFSQ